MACTLLVGTTWGAPSELVDGRHWPAAGDFEEQAEWVSLQEAAAAARAYWQPRNSVYEHDFRVLAVADGAFTRAFARQQAVLYRVSLWPRCCPNLGIAVLEDERLLYNVTFDRIAQTLTVVPDLDGDGSNELVVTGAFGMGGSNESSYRLLSFDADRLVDLGGGALAYSNCATGAAERQTTAWRWLASPGPFVMVERFLQRCGEHDWERTNGPEPAVLEPPAEAPFVELCRAC